MRRYLFSTLRTFLLQMILIEHRLEFTLVDKPRYNARDQTSLGDDAYSNGVPRVTQRPNVEIPLEMLCITYTVSVRGMRQARIQDFVGGDVGSFFHGHWLGWESIKCGDVPTPGGDALEQTRRNALCH